MECKHDKWDSKGTGLLWVCSDCGKSEKEIISELRQQNAQLQSDLAQREADCAGMREALERLCERECAFTYGTDHPCVYRLCIKDILSTSSGKDMLENMRVIREALEVIVQCKGMPCFEEWDEIYKTTKQAFAKVKGGA